MTSDPHAVLLRSLVIVHSSALSLLPAPVPLSRSVKLLLLSPLSVVGSTVVALLLAGAGSWVVSIGIPDDHSIEWPIKGKDSPCSMSSSTSLVNLLRYHDGYDLVDHSLVDKY